MNLTVACVLVRGHVGYTPDYVTRLHGMVKRNLKRPHRFVCLTDQIEVKLGGDIEMLYVPPVPGGLFAWWAKTRLFDKGLFPDGRILYLDLDTLIVNSLDPIVDFDATMALVPHAGDFNGKHGKAVVKKFNSSVIIMNAGVHTDIYDEWSCKVARRLWGDQDWIGERAPEASMMPLEWFPRLSQIKRDFPQDSRVILCKRPKNHEAAKQWPWFRELWQ